MTEERLLQRPAVRRTLGVTLVAYWCALFIGTHIPVDDVPLETSDKLLHVLAYAGLAGLLALYAAARWGGVRHRAAPGILALLAIYGAIDELTQIPAGRTADVEDWAADLLGTCIGIAAALLASRYLRSRGLSE